VSTVAESREIVSALRSGLVPRRGLTHFATGMEALAKAVGEELDFVAGGKGLSKWIRGEYGTGKTFAARYLCAEARARGFATSEVQISINDTPLHHLETVYRRMVERLETAADGQSAFQAVVDGWLYQLGEEVRRVKGLAEDDPAFADATEERLEDKLADLSRRNPAFAQVLRGYHRALHGGDFAAAQGLLAWLSGQPHTERGVMSEAGVRGRIDGQAALTFLGGILQLLRQSGYSGLVMVLDEVETIQRMNAQTRVKALIALRQLMDMLASEDLPGLYVIVTGTRDFYDGYKGLKQEPALYQRVNVKFDADARWDNLRATQVRLLPFDEDRLFRVGQRVRDLYPTEQTTRILDMVSDAFLRSLASQVTTGFGGRVAVAPRLFLRELTDVLDRVDQHQDFDPVAHYKLTIDEGHLRPEELAAARGEAAPALEAEGDDSEDGEPVPSVGPKRLDG
jgi:hypothetical protein